MKHRSLSLILSLAVSAALLTSCGAPKDGGAQSGSQQPSASQSGEVSTPDASSPDVSAPDASSPDASAPDASTPDASSPDASAPDGSQQEGGESQGALKLNRTDFSLFTVGQKWQLKAQGGSGITWSSSDEAVATVAEDGTVTYVAPGHATITATSADGLSAKCEVYCKAEEQQEEKPAGGSDTSSGSQGPEAQVDLDSFAQDVIADYEFPFMMTFDDEGLNQLYAGLTGLSLAQKAVYQCGMSPAPAGDLALVEVKDAGDVDAVKAIFQARIDYMVGDGNGPGGAWYPGPTTMWDEQSRIVSKGNYVMLVVHEKCDAIVDAFNALF